jgi:hypothetical protein
MKSAGRILVKMDKNARKLAEASITAGGAGLSYLGIYDNSSGENGRGGRPPPL